MESLSLWLFPGLLLLAVASTQPVGRDLQRPDHSSQSGALSSIHPGAAIRTKQPLADELYHYRAAVPLLGTHQSPPVPHGSFSTSSNGWGPSGDLREEARAHPSHHHKGGGASGSNITGSGATRPAVVFAKHSEDVRWVQGLIRLHKKTFDVLVYQSWSHRAPNYVPNSGFESTKYLKFIVDHYYNLPPVVMFLHAHNKAHHNPCGASTFLSHFKWKPTPGMYSITSELKSFPYKGFSDWNTLKWTDLLRWGQELAGVAPLPYNKTHPLVLPMNAQFAVARERILQHPLEVYERLYAVGTQPCQPPEWMLARNPDRPFILNDCDQNRMFGLAMEISLQAILSANQFPFRWVQGKKHSCYAVCNKKDGIYCQMTIGKHRK